jgi:hypothetical protein
MTAVTRTIEPIQGRSEPIVVMRPDYPDRSVGSARMVGAVR